MSCRKHRSPHTAVTGPAARAMPTTVETNPSMPFAPRFALTRRSSRGSMPHSSARTGRLDATASRPPAGTRPSNVARDRGFARDVVGIEHRIHGGAGASLGAAPFLQPRRFRRAGREDTRQRVEQRLPVGSDAHHCLVRRIEPRAVGIDEHLRYAFEPGIGVLARERGTDPEHELGPVGGRELGRARQCLVCGDRERAGAHVRERIGEHRPAGGRREAGERVDADVRTRSRDDHAARVGAHESLDARDRLIVGRAHRTRRTRPGFAASRPGTSTSGAPVGTNGSRNGRLRCTGPAGGPSASATARDANGRHERCGRGVGRTEIAEPVDGGAEQMRLIDRLRGTDAAQLGRPVGGAHEQRHSSVPGFDHCRVQVRGRGPRRAAHDDGPPGRHRHPEGAECGRSFVEDDVDGDAIITGEREDQRRVARPGRHDGMGHAGAGELVDEGHRERGGHIHGRHQARIRGCGGLCWFRGSPRRRARGGM